MPLSETQTVGFLQLVIELLVRESSVLKKNNVDVDGLRARAETALKQLISASSYQEDLTRRKVRSTIDLVAQREEGYRMASDTLNRCIAAVGGTTPEAENYRRLRSRIRRVANGGEIEAEESSEESVQPEPEPVAAQA
jgi:hypothetical protein